MNEIKSIKKMAIKLSIVLLCLFTVLFFGKGVEARWVEYDVFDHYDVQYKYLINETMFSYENGTVELVETNYKYQVTYSGEISITVKDSDVSQFSVGKTFQCRNSVNTNDVRVCKINKITKTGKASGQTTLKINASFYKVSDWVAENYKFTDKYMANFIYSPVGNVNTTATLSLYPNNNTKTIDYNHDYVRRKYKITTPVYRTEKKWVDDNTSSGSSSSGSTSSGSTSSGSSSSSSSSSGSSSGSSTTTQTEVVDRSDLTDNARKLYIRNLYKRVLGREPSNNEISGHFKNSSQKEAIDIIFSTESKNRNNINGMTNAQFVEACYQYILGRTADSSGKTTWTNYLANGNSRENLVKQLVSSAEFKKNNNLSTTTITLNKNTCTAVYNVLKGSKSIIKPTDTTVLMYTNDVNGVTSLKLDGKSITDLSGLTTFKNLKVLSLTTNSVSDLTKISKLTNLEELYLSKNSISSLKGIESLTKLKKLHLNDNKLTSLSGVEKLTALKELQANNNNISSIPVLKGLTVYSVRGTNYKTVIFNDKILAEKIQKEFGISNIIECNGKYVLFMEVAKLKAKTSINLSSTKRNPGIITDITGLEEIEGLTSIDLSNNKISNFSKLSGLKNLTTLNIKNNGLTKLDSLKTVKQLKNLNASNNAITSIAGIKNLTLLQELDLSNNKIANNLQEISSLTKLTSVSLINNAITNVSGLANLKATSLDLSKNGIADISPVKGIANLSYNNNNVIITVSGTQVDIPAVLKNVINNYGVSKLEFTGCSIKNNKLVFDSGIILAQVRIKAGDLTDTIVTVQTENIASLGKTGSTSDETAPTCQVEYDNSNIKNKVVKVTIWADEEIDAFNAYDYARVVKKESNGNKKYGVVLYYTENTNTTVIVKDLSNNLSSVNVKIDNIK